MRPRSTAYPWGKGHHPCLSRRVCASPLRPNTPTPPRRLRRGRLRGTLRTGSLGMLATWRCSPSHTRWPTGWISPPAVCRTVGTGFGTAARPSLPTGTVSFRAVADPTRSASVGSCRHWPCGRDGRSGWTGYGSPMAIRTGSGWFARPEPRATRGEGVPEREPVPPTPTTTHNDERGRHASTYRMRDVRTPSRTG